jgi:threonine aldolase
MRGAAAYACVVTDEERLRWYRAATRFLSGHGPTPLRKTMEALAREVGEEERGDVYGKGQGIERLEAEVSALLGKPAAVFLPSGTMAQQIALRIWAERRGSRVVAFHPTSHLELHEERAYAHLHGLEARLVGAPDAPLSLADLSALHTPVGALLIELPQREIGGHLPSWDDLKAQTAWARERGTALHLDGARLWESQPFYGRPLADIAGLFDSVYVSFYKTLGGVAGAALAGPEDFVREARTWQRRHGGNLYSLTPYVLAARAGLRERLPRIPLYVQRAREVADVFTSFAGVTVYPHPPHTNMMHVVLPGEPDALMDEAAAIARDEGVALFLRPARPSVEGRTKFELSIGEGALALDDALLARLLRRLLAATPA